MESKLIKCPDCGVREILRDGSITCYCKTLAKKIVEEPKPKVKVEGRGK